MYSDYLNTGLVWYSNSRFVSGCQMVRYLNGGLKTGLKKPVYGPKCPAFKWSAKSCDFTIQTPILSGIQTNLCIRCYCVCATNYSKTRHFVQYSTGSAIQFPDTSEQYSDAL